MAKKKAVTSARSTGKRATSGKAKTATGGNYLSTPTVEIRQTSRNVCGVYFRYNREPGRPLVHLSNISASLYTELLADQERYGKFKTATKLFHRAAVIRASNRA